MSGFAFGQGRVNVVDNKGTMSKTGVEIITSASAPTVPTPIKGDLWVDNSNSSGYNKVFKVYDAYQVYNVYLCKCVNMYCVYICVYVCLCVYVLVRVRVPPRALRACVYVCVRSNVYM